MPCSATALPATLGQEEQNGCRTARAPSCKAGSRTSHPFPPGELATELHICRISCGPGEKRAWEMLSPLPGTSYVPTSLIDRPTPTASLNQVPQEQATASALKPEEPLKNKKTKKTSEKTTQQHPSKKPGAQTCQRIAWRPTKQGSPALEITVSLTNICLLASVF